MKLLLDQGLPRSTVQRLAAIGITAEHIGNLGLATASDQEVLQKASERQDVLVSLDADFHQILATTHAKSPSVIRLRVEGLTGVQLASLLEQVVNTTEQELAAGAVASVTVSRIRVRSLPIGQ
jgi:predicted nuclease of predicted toxin-antitoxin system